jgi:hypothetical protein
MKKLTPERERELFSPESIEMFKPKLDAEGKQVYKEVTNKKTGKVSLVKDREKYIVHEENPIKVVRRVLKMDEIKLTVRNCLGCSEKFESEGIHNRLCNECASYRGMI